MVFLCFLIQEFLILQRYIYRTRPQTLYMVNGEILPLLEFDPGNEEPWGQRARTVSPNLLLFMCHEAYKEAL